MARAKQVPPATRLLRRGQRHNLETPGPDNLLIRTHGRNSERAGMRGRGAAGIGKKTTERYPRYLKLVPPFFSFMEVHDRELCFDVVNFEAALARDDPIAVTKLEMDRGSEAAIPEFIDMLSNMQPSRESSPEARAQLTNSI